MPLVTSFGSRATTVEHSPPPGTMGSYQSSGKALEPLPKLLLSQLLQLFLLEFALHKYRPHPPFHI